MAPRTCKDMDSIGFKGRDAHLGVAITVVLDPEIDVQVSTGFKFAPQEGIDAVGCRVVEVANLKRWRTLFDVLWGQNLTTGEG